MLITDTVSRGLHEWVTFAVDVTAKRGSYPGRYEVHAGGVRLGWVIRDGGARWSAWMPDGNYGGVLVCREASTRAGAIEELVHAVASGNPHAGPLADVIEAAATAAVTP